MRTIYSAQSVPAFSTPGNCACKNTPVTEFIVGWRSGDREALQSLIPLVYDEMRRLAHSYICRERPDHTLQSTALVHEAYARLAANAPPNWQDRAHFFGDALKFTQDHPATPSCLR